MAEYRDGMDQLYIKHHGLEASDVFWACVTALCIEDSLVAALAGATMATL